MDKFITVIVRKVYNNVSFLARKDWRRCSLVIALMLSLATAQAATITTAQAKRIAQTFFQARNGALMTTEPVVVYSDADADGQRGCSYVCNADNDEGWVIVAGDDRLGKQILGFSLQGSLVTTDMPEPMNNALINFADAALQVAKGTLSQPANAPSIEPLVNKTVKEAKHDIAPMIKSRWGQKTGGYNKYCPTVNGTDTYTGCNATSMAQIMYQYQYPRYLPYKIPEKSLSGRSDWSSQTFKFAEVPAGTPIDWDNMLPAYTTFPVVGVTTTALETTEEQQDAVAHLMAYCGQAIGAAYGPDGTARANSYIPDGIAAFGYPSAKATYRTYIKSNADAYLEDLIYWELSQGRSVVTGGKTNKEATGADGSHSFVIDGYDAGTGNFHVNWGWYGYPDAYYQLSLLNPTRHDGGMRQYSDNQDFVLGLAPEVKFMEATSFTTDGKTFKITAKVLDGCERFSYYVSMGLINKNGTLSPIYPRKSLTDADAGTEYTFETTTDLYNNSNNTYDGTKFTSLATGTQIDVYPVCVACHPSSTGINLGTINQSQCYGVTFLSNEYYTLEKTSNGFKVVGDKKVECYEIDKDGNKKGFNVLEERTLDAKTTMVDLRGVKYATSLTEIPLTLADDANPNLLVLIHAEDKSKLPAAFNGKNIIEVKDDGTYTAKEIKLTDGHDYYSSVGYTAEKISYTRTPQLSSNGGSSGWETIALPFAATGAKRVSDGKLLSWFTTNTQQGESCNMWIRKLYGYDGTKAVFGLPGDELEANTPYIIAVPGNRWGEDWNLEGKEIVFTAENATIEPTRRCVTEVENVYFAGSMEEKTVNGTFYVLNGAGSQFVATATPEIQAFRGYISAPVAVSEGKAALAIGKYSIPTGIVDVSTEVELTDDAVYNLQGQRVERAQQKGVYIKNGKKIIVGK